LPFRLTVQLKHCHNGVYFFGFYSLDVEGGKYDVLKAIDFDTLAFGVIFYEMMNTMS
jgi:hypothetical protein